MVVTYDRSIKIAGIGMTPWSSLGLERWFDSCAIVTFYDLKTSPIAHLPTVLVLSDKTGPSTKNIQKLIDTVAFTNLSEEKLLDYYFLPHQPLVVGRQGLRRRFLMVDSNFTTTFENKAWLREHFSRDIPFPPFVIAKIGTMKPTLASYRSFAPLGKRIVLQSEQSSDGDGTYIVSNFNEYIEAMNRLPQDGKIVVSSYISGRERSVQCCATRDGIIVSDLQKQIIRAPELTNLSIGNIHSFCGAEIGTDNSSPVVVRTVEAYAHTIGQALYRRGYRGIFGVDLLVKGDEVFVLEVNARTTGVTPLINVLYEPEHTPLYLLHILELGNFAYTASGPSIRSSPIGSVLLLHNRGSGPGRITKTLQTGMYKMADGKLQFERPDIRFDVNDDHDTFLVEAYAPVGRVVRPGDRLLAVYLRRSALNANDRLTSGVHTLIRLLYDQCKMRSTS